MSKDKDNIFIAIENLLAIEKSDQLIFHTMLKIVPSKRRIVLLLSIFIAICIIYFMFYPESGTPILAFIDLIEMVNEITLPIIAVAITGYAIFQALVSGDTLITLLSVKDEEYSKFQTYNNFFFGFSILFLFIIIFNFILSILLKNINLEWYFPLFNSTTNNVLFSSIISLYITFIINALIEIKSFIYNLYQIFNINAASKGIEHLNGKK